MTLRGGCSSDEAISPAVRPLRRESALLAESLSFFLESPYRSCFWLAAYPIRPCPNPHRHCSRPRPQHLQRPRYRNPAQRPNPASGHGGKLRRSLSTRPRCLPFISICLNAIPSMTRRVIPSSTSCMDRITKPINGFALVRHRLLVR